MMTKNRVTITAAIIAGLTSTAAQAAVLATYDFELATEGTSNTSVVASFATKDTDTNSTASAFSETYSITTGNPGHLTGVNDWTHTDNSKSDGTGTSTGTSAGSFYVNYSATPTAVALSDTDFLTFSVTPTAGYKLNLTSLTFDVRTTNAPAVAGGNKYYVASSVNGFSSFLLSETFLNQVWAAKSIDLSAFQILTAATEFRIYFENDHFGVGRSNHIDNVVLNGESVLIPEPASLGLLGLGAMMLLGRRR